MILYYHEETVSGEPTRTIISLEGDTVVYTREVVTRDIARAEPAVLRTAAIKLPLEVLHRYRGDFRDLIDRVTGKLDGAVAKGTN